MAGIPDGRQASQLTTGKAASQTLAKPIQRAVPAIPVPLAPYMRASTRSPFSVLTPKDDANMVCDAAALCHTITPCSRHDLLDAYVASLPASSGHKSPCLAITTADYVEMCSLTIHDSMLKVKGLQRSDSLSSAVRRASPVRHLCTLTAPTAGASPCRVDDRTGAVALACVWRDLSRKHAYRLMLVDASLPLG
jgi:hypothetical protein